MLSDTTWRIRKALQQAEQWRSSRIVDMGVRIHVVRQCFKNGRDIISGLAPVCSVRTHDRGGLYDTHRGQFVGRSVQPLVWYLSEAQEQIVLHDASMRPKLLVYGAMGAGKTVSLASWIMLRALEFSGQDVEIGGTAPTGDRTEMLLRELTGHMRPEWYHYRAKERLLCLRNGVRIRLITTTPRSAELGSPIQGWNWVACASDEIQDSIKANSDIEARGRRAPGGMYRRFCTATAKDSPAWRNFRDKLGSGSKWAIHRMMGTTNPFVYPSYWETLREEMSERDYQRIVLAMDVGPERATYPSWSHEHNIRPIPDVGAKDVTASILREVTGRDNYTMLVGHDPGTIQDVSVMLKAYKLPGDKDHVWFVVDELKTSGTTESHAQELLARLRDRWSMMLPTRSGAVDEFGRLVHLRVDPYGDSDNRTDISVHKQFANLGFHVRSAAYKNGKGSGRIPKEAGIEMINKLFCSAAGVRRLFVACDERRQPCAPDFVRSIELSERDEVGKAEVKVKGKEDVSHHCAAVRYALFRFEKLRLGSEAIREAH